MALDLEELLNNDPHLIAAVAGVDMTPGGQALLAALDREAERVQRSMEVSPEIDTTDVTRDLRCKIGERRKCRFARELVATCKRWMDQQARAGVRPA